MAGVQIFSIFSAKGTSLRESTSFEPFCVKNGWGSDLQVGSGKKLESHRDSHRKDMSPLTQGLNYRSACDNDIYWNAAIIIN